VFVEESVEEALASASKHYGRTVELTRDEDVLDTWFSSALWPFTTLGWPRETEDLKRFYPTHTLATGFDIIFFWVARMMMMGLHFTGEAPFKRVFINALVLDEKGQKMSKTKGNVIDPLDLVDVYGADAVRFTLTAMTGQARSIKLSKQRIEGYRNFGTKLWNAARFCQMNECQRTLDFDPAAMRLTLNRWIRGEAAKTVRAVTEGFEACAFDDAAGALYRFIWNVFCDWYLELAKPILNGADEAATAETRATAAWVLDLCLKLLHPVSPFITEELWDKLSEFGAPRPGMLITTAWPEAPSGWVDAEAEAEIGWLIDLVSEVRSIRAEMNVPPSARAPLTLSGAGAAMRLWLERHRDLILTLARLSAVREGDAPPGAAPFVIDEATAFLSIAEFIDVAAERARLVKEIGALATEIDRTAKKLANPDFVARAPDEVVEENRERLAAAEAAKAKLEAALARLKGMG
ncbi:MAG TPA: class I tRNA ligase family protein, partial [Caulobacteraceae bacterium]|nr:class I tRNA ligase family protein [Caulobacteraceae bacterium]